AQKHFYLNANLGERNIGSFRVRCENPAPGQKIIVQSLFYGHLSDSTIPAVEWSYASQARGTGAPQGSTIFAPVNTFIGAFNWLKSQNNSAAATVFDLRVLTEKGETVDLLASNAIAANGNRDIGVHEIVGPNF